MDDRCVLAREALPAWPVSTATVHASPLARSPLPHPRLPQAPCPACNVRHLCMAEVGEQGGEILDGLTIGRRRLRKHQKLYRAGEPFEFLFAVRLGTLKATMGLGDGLEHIAAFHFGGDVIGLDGLADGRYPATVQALENVEVCSISHARLGDACAASKPMRRRVSQLTGMNILREYRVVRLVRQRLSESRVAGFLLEMSRTMQERGYSAREFQLRMSRAEIGSYLGIAPETVSRAVSDFQRQGLIRVRSRRIELLQPDALREFAEAPSRE